MGYFSPNRCRRSVSTNRFNSLLPFQTRSGRRWVLQKLANLFPIAGRGFSMNGFKRTCKLKTSEPGGGKIDVTKVIPSIFPDCAAYPSSHMLFSYSSHNLRFEPSRPNRPPACRNTARFAIENSALADPRSVRPAGMAVCSGLSPFDRTVVAGSELFPRLFCSCIFLICDLERA